MRLGNMLLRMVAAVRKFKHFLALNECTVGTFPIRAEANIKIAVSKGTTAPKALPEYQSKMGQPLLVDDIDSVVQRYLLDASN